MSRFIIYRWWRQVRGRVLPPKKSRDMAVFKGESFLFFSDKDIDGQSLLGLVETGASQITEQIIPQCWTQAKNFKDDP